MRNLTQGYRKMQINADTKTAGEDYFLNILNRQILWRMFISLIKCEVLAKFSPPSLLSLIFILAIFFLFLMQNEFSTPHRGLAM